MPSFFKIEKISRDVAISCFLLMFGYKLFSLYFPLFLVNRGFSLPEVGYAYLLIYLPIALLSPIVGFLNHKINSVILLVIGIAGYSFYALAMIFTRNTALFYFWQMFLGVSAALFFVSSRIILMTSRLKDHNRSFAWFYAAPFYADAFAPALGAFTIWKFGFSGVFFLSLIFQIFNAIFCFNQLKNQEIKPADNGFSFRKYQENYKNVFKKIKSKNTAFLLIVAFLVLFIEGFNGTYFVLFLKSINWEQNEILRFSAVASVLFLPISLLAIRQVGRQESGKSVFKGSFAYGFFSILLGLIVSLLNFFSAVLLAIGRNASGLMVYSGRSGFLTKKLKDYPEEAGSIDTIFSPLGTALGSLFFGLIIGFFGFQFLFISSGILLIAAALFYYFLNRRADKPV